MTTFQNALVVGIFQHETEAKHAIEDLRNAGFAKEQIGFAMREGGAVTTHLLNDLVSLGVPQERAAFYNQHYTEGHAVISVRADGREQDAVNILGADGATGFNDARRKNDMPMNNSAANMTTASAYDNANSPAYNNQDPAFNNTNNTAYNNQNPAYNNTNNAAYNNQNPATHNNQNPAYENTNNAAYAGNRVDFTDQDRSAAMTNDQTNNRPMMGSQQAGYTETQVDRDGNPRMQNNEDAWAKKAAERHEERDTRNNS
jgi:hypothetical protein